MEQSENIAIVTGAGSGIGQAITLGLLDDGFEVYGLGRSIDKLESTASRDTTGKFHPVKADVANGISIRAVVGDILKENDAVSVLVNNAATYPRKSFLETSEDEWDRVMDVNVNAVARLCRLVLPNMLKNHYGRIINVGSLADKAPIAGASAYSASKGALHALTRAVAAEVDPLEYPDVIVNEFLPPDTATEMSEDGVEADSLYPAVKKLIDLPAGSGSGKSFSPEREILPNLGLKKLLVHAAKTTLRLS